MGSVEQQRRARRLDGKRVWACLSQRSDAWIGLALRRRIEEDGDVCGRPGTLAPLQQMQVRDVRRSSPAACSLSRPTVSRPIEGARRLGPSPVSRPRRVRGGIEYTPMRPREGGTMRRWHG